MSFFRSLCTVSCTLLLVAGTVFYTACTSADKRPARILVFTKTAGFRHIDAIEAGIPALKKLGETRGFTVDTTEDAGRFNEEDLKRYRAVIFLNVSGEVFDAEQRTAFQRYIQAGGGFVGIHAPVDAERTWPWYGQMIGAYFRSHPANPNVQKGTYVFTGEKQPVLDSLPARFERTDEFYDFDIMNPAIQVLVTIDEKTYQGGKTGDNHPAVWYHDFEGGRSFYTAMGHTKESYSDPVFLKIVGDGIAYAMGNGEPLEYSRAVPEENRFTKQVLMEKLDEPMHLAIAADGKLYFAQRRGEIMEYDQEKQSSRMVGKVAVNAKYEDGLLGMTLDPDFINNRRLYVFYTNWDGLAFNVSRFTLDKENKLDQGSEKVLLKIPKDILDGSHTGGGLLFDQKGSGNLFITVGDNSSPRAWSYAPIDQRKGKEHWDAQRSSANTNDLRGKILRIHPEPDGTYTIPDGNLFPKGTPGTRPEIYSMGHRQPWRLSMDTKTGWLYIGEVGPDANDDSTGLGPKGYDEFNQIRQPGNFGWPQFIADNKAYWQYDFETGKSGEQFDAQKPINRSVNNTGLQQLPPAQKALLWYPYGTSKEYPLMESGARSATGGPVFRKANFKKSAAHVFPDYYEGKWFITDWIRGWINVVSMDEQGNYVSMERFMPGYTFSNPIDLQFGPDGNLYMLEYGKGWFRANDDARLVRIEYNAGNRAPIAKASADKRTGKTPLQVKLSAANSFDYDKEELTYQWEIKRGNETVQRFSDKEPAVTLDKPGIYTALLTVKDKKGATGQTQLHFTAAAGMPALSIDITRGNQTFFFPGAEISYQVNFDGKPATMDAAARTRLNIEYMSGGFTPLLGDPDPNKPMVSEDAVSLYGGMVLNSSDCYSCHTISKRSAGPSFTEISERYKNNAGIASTLESRIIKGNSGEWGAAAMSAHPDLDPGKVKEMVTFILSLAKPAPPALPLDGKYTFRIPAAQPDEETPPGGDVFLLKAMYTDSSDKNLPALNTEIVKVLRNPELRPGAADQAKDIMRVKVPGVKPELVVMYGSQPYIAYKGIDLSGIRSIELDISPAMGALLEIHLGSPEGTLIGSYDVPAGRGSFAAGTPVRIPLQTTQGVQDVYITGRNTTAQRSDILFILTGLRFRL